MLFWAELRGDRGLRVAAQGLLLATTSMQGARGGGASGAWRRGACVLGAAGSLRQFLVVACFEAGLTCSVGDLFKMFLEVIFGNNSGLLSLSK